MEKQKTINKPVSYTGIGLHTGNPSTVTFKPAPANYGCVFVRTDIEKRVEIPALVDYVVDLSRGTTIAKDGVKVHTVEHVMAALAGLKIDNCIIELSANEPPVMDGSSIPYVEAILQAGIKELDAEREYFVIKETVRYSNEEKHVDIVALPTDDFRITVMIDYFNPALGSQHTGLFNLEKEFVTEFAPARTFCFLTEVEQLYKAGLIKGGSLESALVIGDKEMNDEETKNLQEVFKLEDPPKVGENGYLNNTQLRYKNEPARHKLLDMIGDLALIGVPIKAQILAARPGHASNYEFSKIIREMYLKQKEETKRKAAPSEMTVKDIYDILEALPHRYPFILVDRVKEYDPEENSIVCVKNVTINEPFFQGHFPGKPIMPGVLILEALAQAGGLLIFYQIEDAKSKLALFASMSKAKFRKPVIPGDQIVLEVKQIGRKFNTYSFQTFAYVDGNIVTEAQLQAALIDR